MPGSVSAGVEPTVSMTQNRIFQTFFQTVDTTIRGKQQQDTTEYALEHPKDALTSLQLSKMEQIVEYLKVLYR
jgi:chaperone required for assembly of F1-ATPase